MISNTKYYTLDDDTWFQTLDFEDQDIYLTENEIEKIYRKGLPLYKYHVFKKRVNLKNIWEPVDITFKEYYRSQKLRFSPDIKFYGMTILCLSEKSLEVLREFFTEDMEILPVNNIFSDKKYFFINFTSDLDCLGNNAIYEDYGPLITKIKKYDFKYEVIKNKDIFKIKKEQNIVYVSERVVNKVLENKLRGFVFHPKWSVELGDLYSQEESIRSSGKLPWYDDWN